MTHVFQRLPLILLCLAGTIMGVVTDADAHRLRLFAMVEGEELVGYAYFPGGGRAANLTLHILGPDDELLAKMTTDTEGAFTYHAGKRADHLIRVITADGHQAECLIPAADLPESLPGPALSSAPSAAVSPEPIRSSAAMELDHSIARQLRPLREEIDQLKEQIWLRDILGGIGYIFGIMGIILYRKSRLRRRGEPPPPG